MKRIPELRDLSDDHHVALVVAQHCKRASRPDSEVTPEQIWGQVLETFSSHLEPHFQIEEAHLLPALCAIGETSLADKIREDHAALRDLIAERVSPRIIARTKRQIFFIGSPTGSLLTIFQRASVIQGEKA